MRPKGTKAELERRRRRVIELIEQGKKESDIATFLGLHVNTVRRWKREVREQGSQILNSKPQPGRTPKLQPEQFDELKRLLLQGAKAHGFPDDLWSGQRVQELIRKQFGVDYHIDHVHKLLKTKLHFSSQKPKKKAYEADDWDIDFWKNDKFHDLVSHAQERRAHLVFLDESGFQLTPNLRRSYAPIGHTPVLTCSNERQRISVISCVTVSPQRQNMGFYFRMLSPNENVCGSDIVDFLRELRQSLPRMLVIWDGASIHARSSLVRSYLANQTAIEEETLPAYAPELNPDEYVWSYLKHSRLYHYNPTNVIDLHDRLEQELITLSTNQKLLQGFVRHSELQLVAA